MDMHSGGRTKEGEFEYIYIESSQKEAEVIFYNRFGHSPNRVSCTCCGNDYSISEEATLESVTAYERGCVWDKKQMRYVEKGEYSPLRQYTPLRQYLKNPNILVIRKKNIKASERKGELPEQGYVWVD